MRMCQWGEMGEGGNGDNGCGEWRWRMIATYSTCVSHADARYFNMNRK